jgi:hypothetical protein
MLPQQTLWQRGLRLHVHRVIALGERHVASVQEEEQLAVQAHLNSATAAASVAAQASADKPPAVPEINFYDAWKATAGFSAECAP